MNRDKKILFWAYFWRYGIIALAILPFLIVGGISAITDNYNYTLFLVALLNMPSVLIVTGIYYIIGTKLEFTHLCCVSQSMSHQKMNPYRVEWTEHDKKEMIGAGIALLVIGTICLIGFIICITNSGML